MVHPRSTTPAGALSVARNSVASFTDQRQRTLVSPLLDQPVSSTQMTYDLRRLCFTGLITRIARTNRCTLTEE